MKDVQQESKNRDLASIQKAIIEFRDARNWSQFHDPKNLVQALSIEVAELQEIFLWKTTEESKNISPRELEMVKNELADIFIFVTYLCNHFKIDLSEAVKTKVQLNDKKYPVSKSKGSRKKYTELE